MLQNWVHSLHAQLENTIAQPLICRLILDTLHFFNMCFKANVRKQASISGESDSRLLKGNTYISSIRYIYIIIYIYTSPVHVVIWELNHSESLWETIAFPHLLIDTGPRDPVIQSGSCNEMFCHSFWINSNCTAGSWRSVFGALKHEALES